MSTKIPDIIQNREKIGQYVVFAAFAAFGLYAAYNILPYAVHALDMLQTAAMRMLAIGGALTVGALLFTNFGTILRLGKVFSRMLTRQFVAIDPISFMEEIMSSVEDRMGTVREKVGALKAAKTEVANEQKELQEAIADIKRKVAVVEDVRQAEFLGRDLDRKERSLGVVQQRLQLLTQYETALKDVREIGEIRLQDLRSELEEAERAWRLNKSTSGLAADMRAVMNPGDDEAQWGTALTVVNSSLGETFASLDMLMEDMEGVIANRKLEGSVAVARIAELRAQAGTGYRVEDPKAELGEMGVPLPPLPPVDTKTLKLGR